MVSGIYAIENRTNHKVYIGSSVDIDVRWCTHISELNKKVHYNSHLQRAWDKYGGVLGFYFHIIEIVDDITTLYKVEQWWLNILQPFGDNGYNISRVSIGWEKGRKHTEESRQKMSELAKNRSPEHLKKIADANRGRKHSEEARKKIAEAAHNISEETRKKISESGKGRKVSEETRRKISAGNKKTKATEEMRKKMSESQKRRQEKIRQERQKEKENDKK